VAVGSASRLPFSYRPGGSVFHRLSAGAKLLGLILFSSLAVASPGGLVVAAIMLAVACVVARTPPWGVFRGSRPLAFLALVLLLAKTFGPGNSGIDVPAISVLDFRIPAIHIPAISPSGFLEGLRIALRIFVIFAGVGFLFSVTTMRELRISLELLESTLKRFARSIRGKPREENGIAYFSLGISLMLGFIPRFFETWETANLACRSRSCGSGLRRLSVIVPLVMERMMETAAETVLALEARGLGCK